MSKYDDSFVDLEMDQEYTNYGNPAVGLKVPKYTWVTNLGYTKNFFIPNAFKCCGDHASHRKYPNNGEISAVVHVAVPSIHGGTERELIYLNPAIADKLKEYTNHWMMVHYDGPLIKDMEEDLEGSEWATGGIDILEMNPQDNHTKVFFNTNNEEGLANGRTRDGLQNKKNHRRFLNSNFSFLPYERLGWDRLYNMEIWDTIAGTDQQIYGGYAQAGGWTKGAEGWSGYLGEIDDHNGTNSRDVHANYAGLTSVSVPTVYGPIGRITGTPWTTNEKMASFWIDPATGEEVYEEETPLPSQGVWDLALSDYVVPLYESDKGLDPAAEIGDMMHKYYGSYDIQGDATSWDGYYILNDDFVLKKLLEKHTTKTLEWGSELDWGPKPEGFDTSEAIMYAKTTTISGQAPPLFFPMTNNPKKQLEQVFEGQDTPSALAATGPTSMWKDPEDRHVLSITTLSGEDKHYDTEWHPFDVARNMQHTHEYYVDEHGNGFTTSTITVPNHNYMETSPPDFQVVKGVDLQFVSSTEIGGPQGGKAGTRYEEETAPLKPDWVVPRVYTIPANDSYYPPPDPTMDPTIPQEHVGEWQPDTTTWGKNGQHSIIFERYPAIHHHVHPIINWKIMPIGIDVYSPPGQEGVNPHYPLMFPPDVKWIHDHVVDFEGETFGKVWDRDEWQAKPVYEGEHKWSAPIPGGRSPDDELRGDVYLEMLDLHMDKNTINNIYDKYDIAVHKSHIGWASSVGDVFETSNIPQGEFPKMGGVKDAPRFLESFMHHKILSELGTGGYQKDEDGDGTDYWEAYRDLVVGSYTGAGDMVNQWADTAQNGMLAYAVDLFHKHLRNNLFYNDMDFGDGRLFMIPGPRPGSNVYDEGIAGEINLSYDLTDDVTSFYAGFASPRLPDSFDSTYGISSADSNADRVFWDITNTFDSPIYSVSDALTNSYNFHDIQYENWVKKYAGTWSVALLPNIWLHSLYRNNAAKFLPGSMARNLISAGGHIDKDHWDIPFTGLQQYFDIWSTQPGQSNTNVSPMDLKEGRNLIISSRDYSLLDKYGPLSDAKLNFPMYTSVKFEARKLVQPQSSFAAKINKNELMFKGLLGHLFPSSRGTNLEETKGWPYSLNFARQSPINFYRMYGSHQSTPYRDSIFWPSWKAAEWKTDDTKIDFWNITNFFYSSIDMADSGDIYGVAPFNDYDDPGVLDHGQGLGGQYPRPNALHLDTKMKSKYEQFEEEHLAENMEDIIELIREKKRSIKDIFDGHQAYTENIFFELRKYAHEHSEESEKREQRFFFANPIEEVDRKIIEFIDTQIEYGETYRYKLYGYRIIIGNKYKYCDYLSFMHAGLQKDTAFVSWKPGLGPELVNAEAGPQEWSGDGWDNKVVVYPLESGTKMGDNNDTEIVGQWKALNFPQVFLKRDFLIDFGTTKVVDEPPVPPDLEILPLKDKKDKMLYWLRTSPGEFDAKPIHILESDKQKFLDNAIAQGKSVPNGAKKVPDGTVLHFNTDEPVKRFEMFRLDYKPTSYEDFADGQITLEDGIDTYLDTVEPNKKYYYVFRVVDFHDQISNPTPVYEVEIVFNSGAVYPVIRLADFEITANKSKTKDMKKYVHIVPTIENSKPIVWHDPTVKDHKKPAPWEGGFNHELFSNDFGQTPKFKIRFTSKKTGKKFDINLSFNHEHLPHYGGGWATEADSVVCPDGYQWDVANKKCKKIEN